MLQLLIRGCGRYEQSVTVAYSEADETSASNGAVDDGDDICQLRLKGRIKVGTTADGDKAISVGEASKNADFGRVLKLATDSHDCRQGDGSGDEAGHGGGARRERTRRGESG